MLIQTQQYYQYSAERGFQSFNIGLWWNKSGAQPRDEIGEPDVNYIVEFCSLYLESVTSPNAYRYVGGTDWGVGLDYDIASAPGTKKDGLYVASASSNLTSETWDAKKKTLTVSLTGEQGQKGALYIKFDPAKDNPKNLIVKINGETIDPKSISTNNNLNLLIVTYGHTQKDLTIQISK
jgi:hypothetical protein